jgi:hypothetical protein
MKIPEGRQILSTHVDPKIHERVRIAAVKAKTHMPAVCDAALKLWLDSIKESK